MAIALTLLLHLWKDALVWIERKWEDDATLILMKKRSRADAAAVGSVLFCVDLGAENSGNKRGRQRRRR